LNAKQMLPRVLAIMETREEIHEVNMLLLDIQIAEAKERLESYEFEDQFNYFLNRAS